MMASGPKDSENAFTSSNSPYRHERRNSSDSSDEGGAAGMAGICVNILI